MLLTLLWTTKTALQKPCLTSSSNWPPYTTMSNRISCLIRFRLALSTPCTSRLMSNCSPTTRLHPTSTIACPSSTITNLIPLSLPPSRATQVCRTCPTARVVTTEWATRQTAQWCTRQPAIPPKAWALTCGRLSPMSLITAPTWLARTGASKSTAATTKTRLATWTTCSRICASSTTSILTIQLPITRHRMWICIKLHLSLFKDASWMEMLHFINWFYQTARIASIKFLWKSDT